MHLSTHPHSKSFLWTLRNFADSWQLCCQMSINVTTEHIVQSVRYNTTSVPMLHCNGTNNDCQNSLSLVHQSYRQVQNKHTKSENDAIFVTTMDKHTPKSTVIKI